MKIKFVFISLLIPLLVLPFVLSKPASVSAQTNPLKNIRHVFIILEENKDATALNASNAPYMMRTLTTIGGSALNYHNVPSGSLHPSEPNYVYLEAGTNALPDHTFTTDADSSSSNSTSSTQHLSALLEANGLTWKSYQEGMPSGCPITSGGTKYAAKHNPFVFFQDVVGNPPSASNANCISHMVNLTASKLQSDLASGSVANYNFITPNLNNDMHDGSIQQGDAWLSQIVPIIINSNVFKQDGALFVTFDEGGSGNNPIGMFIVSPFARPGFTSQNAYSHASMVKTVENIFGLSPLLGHAADSGTRDLGEFFGATTQTAPPATATPRTNPTPTPRPGATPTPGSSGKVGDVNSDGHVDIIDIGILVDNYGKNPIPNPKADINHDGKVDIVDIGLVVDNYGK